MNELSAFKGKVSAVRGSTNVEHIANEDRLLALVSAWERLAEAAAEPNKLMQPAMALPAWRHLEGGRHIDWLFVWRGEKDKGKEQLIGVFALASRPPSPRLPFRHTETWRHELGYLGTPLVHARHLDEAVSAVLEWLTARKIRLLRLRQMSAEGPVRSAFVAALNAKCMPFDVYNAHVRACLKSDVSGDDYLQASLGGKRLKEYRRLAKRLGEEGALSFEVLGAEQEVMAAAEEFLALERGGWKGRAGTAIAQDEAALAFFREAVAKLAGTGGLRIVRLALDGKAVAVGILLAAGETAWLWKIAHDEAHARHSPGVLLAIELTRHLLDEGTYAIVDSCAAPDHPMIDHVWRERLAITDTLAVLRPGLVPAAAIFACARAASALAAAIKRLLRRLGRR